MSLHKSFGTNKQSENNGVWVDSGVFTDGDEPKSIRFKLARQCATNKKFQAVLEKEIAPYRQLIAMEQMSSDAINKVLVKVFCNSILLDWENVAGEDGKETKYNVEYAIKLMRELPDLYDFLDKKSKASVTFKDDSLPVVVKN